MNYFVSYVFVGDNDVAYGNLDLKTSAPITEISHVHNVERMIADNLAKAGQVGKVPVLNYIVLEAGHEDDRLPPLA